MKETEITLPTRGLLLEPSLGECDGCDEFVAAHREKDLVAKDHQLTQMALETERLKRWLTSGILGDPTPFESSGSVTLAVDEASLTDG